MTASPIWAYAALALSIPVATLTARFWLRLMPGDRTPAGRLGHIDGLRGYLALGVVDYHFPTMWHYADSGRWTFSDLPLFRNLGPVAVLTFFMITGALFYRQVLDRGEAFRARDLMISRLFRLYPAFLLSLAAVLAIVGVLSHGYLLIDPPELLQSLFDWLLFTLPGVPPIDGVAASPLINAGVLWTLRYEWAFYLALPVVAATLAATNPSARARIAVLLMLLAAMTLAPEIAVAGFRSHIAVAFVYGALAIDLVRIERLAGPAKRRVGTLVGLGALALALLAPVGLYSRLTPAMIFPFFVVVTAGNPCGLFSSRASQALGDASYSIYLFHGIVLFVLFPLLVGTPGDRPQPWLLLPLIVMPIVLLSLAVFRLIERPGIEMGRMLQSRAGRTAIVPVMEVAP
ncbi:MAG: acyltransferase family protein [Sphingomonas sp.]